MVEPRELTKEEKELFPPTDQNHPARKWDNLVLREEQKKSIPTNSQEDWNAANNLAENAPNTLGSALPTTNYVPPKPPINYSPLSAQGMNHAQIDSLERRKQEGFDAAKIASDGYNQTAEVNADAAIDNAKRVAEQEALSTKNYQKAMEMSNSLRDKIAKTSQEKVDPNRFWNNKSTEGKVLSSIGLVLGAIGSGLARTENFALKQLNNAIDLDINSQKGEIENHWKGIVAEKYLNDDDYQKGLHFEQSKSAHRLAALETVGLKLKQIMANTSSEQVKQNALSFAGQLDDEIKGVRYNLFQQMQAQSAAGAANLSKLSKERDALALDLYKTHLDKGDPISIEQAYGEANASGRFNTVANSSNKNEFDKKLELKNALIQSRIKEGKTQQEAQTEADQRFDSDLNMGSRVPNKKETADESAKTFVGVDGNTYVARNPESRKILAGSASATQAVISAAKTYADALAKVGPIDRRTYPFETENMALANSAYNTLMSHIRQAQDDGVWKKGEVEMLAKTLTPPDSKFGNNSPKQIELLVNQAKDLDKAIIKSHDPTIKQSDKVPAKETATPTQPAAPSGGNMTDEQKKSEAKQFQNLWGNKK